MKYRLKEYEEIIREVLESGGEFQMYPKGTSMLPLLREGSDWVMLVKPEGQLSSGDIIFYRRSSGAYVLHRIVRVNEGNYVLCGDNQIQMENDIRREQVIGRVSAVGRGNLVYKKDSFPMRLYERIWCFFPFRRLYFRVFGHRYRIKTPERIKRCFRF